MPEVGDTLGRYTLLRRLAVGGMGEVFVAAKPGPVGFGPYVALKVLRDELACDQQFVDMLVDEANISMFLNHQNVVAVLDLGAEDGTYYIAMEYVQGITVERLVDSMVARGKKLAVPVGLYIGLELCRALKYAHTRVNHSGEPLNIVHRDVTPANLLLSTQGECKLTDFGIARAKGRVHQTQAGVLKGKFGYMAPELVRYERIDARADVFCAGVCLYLMLSGQHPVAGAAVMEAIQRFEEKRIAPPSSLNPEISPALDAIVMRCLEPQVERRWASAAELGDALQDAMLQNVAWRNAKSDGARLIASAIREVAPEAFDAPVSAEQSRHLLEKARADRLRAKNEQVIGALGQDRLHELRARIPTDPHPPATPADPATEEAGPLRPQDLVELPTATSMPAITPDMDFGSTPAMTGEVETDEQLSLHAVNQARDALREVPDTDEQGVGPTDDALEALDEDGSDGAVPSAPADATVSSPVVGGAAHEVGFADSSTDRSRLHEEMLDEPSLPAASPAGDPESAQSQDRTVAQYHAPAFDDPGPAFDDPGPGFDGTDEDPAAVASPAYEEGVIDRELQPSGADDATVVGYEGDRTLDGAQALEDRAPSVGSAQDATVAGVPDFGLPPGVGAASRAELDEAATMIPDGPERFDPAQWARDAAEDDPADQTLLDGIDAADVRAAQARAASEAVVTTEASPAPRLDSAALDQLVADAVAPTGVVASPDPGPTPIAGAPRSADRPPGTVGPGDVARVPSPLGAAASAAPGLVLPPHAPHPAPDPAVEGAGVGDSTGRWMAGELDANALSWDDDAAARRAVATRNQGPQGSPAHGAPQPLHLPSHPPSLQAAPPAPGFFARHGMTIATAALTVALVAGVGYTWFFTRMVWPTVRLQSTPSGAAILVDGAPQPGTTPLEVRLAPGVSHRVEFRLDGYQTQIKQITEEISELRSYRLDAKLVRAAPQLYLPAEGTVFVNGAPVATGQKVELSSLPESGPVTLRVEAKGYRTYEHTFGDPAEIPPSLDVPLTRK